MASTTRESEHTSPMPGTAAGGCALQLTYIRYAPGHASLGTPRVHRGHTSPSQSSLRSSAGLSTPSTATCAALAPERRSSGRQDLEKASAKMSTALSLTSPFSCARKLASPPNTATFVFAQWSRTTCQGSRRAQSLLAGQDVRWLRRSRRSSEPPPAWQHHRYTPKGHRTFRSILGARSRGTASAPGGARHRRDRRHEG